MKNKIYLIDDSINEAGNLIKQLNEIAQQKNTEEVQFEFAFLKGTIPCEYRGEEHFFYDEEIVDTIQKKYAAENKNGVRIGLLLDILLTKEDMESSYANYYPQVNVAKKIYFAFCKQIPTYLITSFPSFATQCDVIMGENLSEKFITKNAVLRYKIQDDIDRLFKFYETGEIGIQ